MSEYFPDKEPRELRVRLVVPMAVLVLAFVILLARLWQLQVMGGAYYSELSKNNRVRLVSISAQRGLIFDRNGIRLAENRPGFDLMIVPEDVSDWKATKGALTRLVSIDEETIDSKLQGARKRPPFEPVKLKRDLSWDEMVRVESSKFKYPGITLSVGPKRTYPILTAAAHLVGYLGEISESEYVSLNTEEARYRRGDLLGKYGLEKSYESYIKGRDGGRHIEVDAVGREIGIIQRYPSVPGNNLNLTIDLGAQLAAWSAMKDVSGAVVAMDPRSGEILALVSQPAFDPNALSIGVSPKQWKEIVSNPLNVLTNRAIQGQYPPASTFKPITAAAALEDGIITPGKKIFSGPSFHFAGRDYRDWKEAGHGEINVHSAIVESSDTFFYQVGLDVGVDRIAHYADSFGLGQRTGIKLRNEKRGLVPSSAWKKRVLGERWYTGETISISVGQGYVLATPLQMVSAYAAIANGGTVLAPMLVKSITTHDGEIVEEFALEEKGRLAISDGTLNILRGALRGVVTEEGGTARRLDVKGLDIAGKTGTAQVARMVEREDDIEKIAYRLRDHAWFVGYAPYDNPTIAVAVLVEHGGFGSRAAAPVALKVIKAYLEGTGRPDEPVENKAPESEGEDGAYNAGDRGQSAKALKLPGPIGMEG